MASFYPALQAAVPDRYGAMYSSGIVLIPFTADDAETAGHIRAELKAQGTPIGAYDLLLSGQAVSNNLTLVTANVGEFSRVPGLKWQNWLA